MKKLGLLLVLSLTLSSCATSTLEDTQMLQNKYEVVYKMPNSNENYITIDSLNHIYHVQVGMKGSILTTIKIK